MNFFAKFYLYRNCYGPESRSSSCLVKNISLVDIRGQCKEIRELFNRFFLGNLSRLSTKVFICAMHPTNPECADLLSKKDSDLRKIIETRGIPCGDKTRNSAMRTAIWSYYGDDLQVNSVELDVTKGDAKPIWEKLQKYLPVYSLFQADRKNSDSDSEVQDPLHAAVKEILQDEDISRTLDHVAGIVEGKLQEVATRTLEKLREMSPDIANTLSPVIPPASSLKWADVFKSVTISGDESICSVA